MSEPLPNTYPTPDWLTKDYLQDALRTGLQQSELQVLSMNIRPATNVGDNFLSRMYRGQIFLKDGPPGKEKISIIIKCPPRGKHVEVFMDHMKFFAKEGRMLTETLPLLTRIMKEAHLPKLFAELYSCQETPRNVIIMEDLCEKSYKPANRLEGLDLNHCKLVLESLAIFHASSLAAIDRDPSIKEKHSLKYWSRENAAYFEGLVKEGMPFIRTWPELPASLVEKMKNFEAGMLEKMFDAADVKEGEFNVLTHGDAWTNNFLFKYEGDIPVSINLVDFQNSVYNNPVTDLLYFIFSSPKDELRVPNINFFLETYHSKFVEICGILRPNTEYSIKHLKNDFVSRLAFGYLASLTVYPFTSAQPTEAIELDDFFAKAEAESATVNIEPFKAARFKSGMRSILAYFDENGLFE